jgi:hypothetical protein
VSAWNPVRGLNMPPPESSPKDSLSLSEICSADSTLALAAASSMASGIPSRRWQTCATAMALFSDRAKSGLAALALSENSLATSHSERLSTAGSRRGPGKDRGRTEKMVSPGTLRASRLVVRMRSSWQ